MTVRSKDSPRVVEFMSLFARLKDWCDDEPNALVDLAKADASVKDLCDRLSWAAHFLTTDERGQPQLFAAPVAPNFLAAWRDYEERYDSELAEILLGDLLAGLDIDLDTDQPTLTTKIERHWADADADAVEQASAINKAIDYSYEHVTDDWRDFPQEFREQIEQGAAAWDKLKRATGFDLRGIFRRRELVPFVLVPRSVAAKHGNAEKLSLLTNLRQAHDAFVFGAPHAALALMRSIMEAILRDHYTAEGKDLKQRIRNAGDRLPPGADAAALDRLRRQANAVLHLRYEKNDRLSNVDGVALEKEVLSLLLVLRALIEEVE